MWHLRFPLLKDPSPILYCYWNIFIQCMQLNCILCPYSKFYTLVLQPRNVANITPLVLYVHTWFQCLPNFVYKGSCFMFVGVWRWNKWRHHMIGRSHAHPFYHIKNNKSLGNINFIGNWNEPKAPRRTVYVNHNINFDYLILIIKMILICMSFLMQKEHNT